MDLFTHSGISLNTSFQRSTRIDNKISKSFLDNFIFHDTGKKVLNQIEERYSVYNNVNWIESSNAPLPYVLSKTNLHLTRDSSVLKEAKMLGIKTGLFDVKEQKSHLISLFENEIEEGYAKIVDILNYNEIKPLNDCYKKCEAFLFFFLFLSV